MKWKHGWSFSGGANQLEFERKKFGGKFIAG
jgi:hypothetical protein